MIDARRIPKGWKSKARWRSKARPSKAKNKQNYKPKVQGLDISANDRWPNSIGVRVVDYINKTKKEAILIAIGSLLIILVLVARCKLSKKSNPKSNLSRKRRNLPTRQIIAHRENILGEIEKLNTEETPADSAKMFQPWRPIKYCVALLVFGQIGFFLATPNGVLYTSKHLHCPEYGYYGACKDFCFQQYGSLDLSTILCLQTIGSLVGLVILLRAKALLGWIIGLGIVLLVQLGTIKKSLTLISSRAHGTPWHILLSREHVTQPFFDCEPKSQQPAYDKYWKLYQESCEFQEPQCKIDRPEVQSYFLKSHLLMSFLSSSFLTITLIVQLFRQRGWIPKVRCIDKVAGKFQRWRNGRTYPVEN